MFSAGELWTRPFRGSIFHHVCFTATQKSVDLLSYNAREPKDTETQSWEAGQTKAGVWEPHSCSSWGHLRTSRDSAHVASVPSAQGATRPWAPVAGRVLPPRWPAGFPPVPKEYAPSHCFYLKSHTRACYILRHAPSTGARAGRGPEQGGSHVVVRSRALPARARFPVTQCGRPAPPVRRPARGSHQEP